MNRTPQILFVTANESFWNQVIENLVSNNLRVTVAGTPVLAKDLMSRRSFDVVITEVGDSDESALDFVREIRASHPEAVNLVIAARISAHGVRAAFREGAADVLLPPFTPQLIEQRILPLILAREKPMPPDSRRSWPAIRGEFENIIAESEPMRRILDLVRKVAPADSTVLVEGESGTGKELIARAIHRQSNRRIYPFVAVNAATLPEGLLESELFGHLKGSFTSATSSRKGLFEQANHGVLFLDEIGDVPPSVQAKLLRVLQDGEVRPVGSNEFVQVDVRLIAATNRGLRDLVEQRQFRQDLYYRLNVIQISLPPLRHRPADILPLAENALGKFARKTGKGPSILAPETRDVLLRYGWPGNVRELENVIERAVILARSDVIGVHDLPPVLRGQLGTPGEETILGATLAEVEQQHIHAIIRQLKGNRTLAAKTLGISRSTLWRKLQEYGEPNVVEEDEAG